MKVYIIARGYYSDKHICGVTLDKDKAHILKKAYDGKDDEYDGNEAYIVTCETDQCLTEIEDGLKVFRCLIDNKASPVIMEEDLDYVGSKDFKVKEFNHGSFDCWYLVYVWARDKDHALKIAADKIAEYKAKEAGV